MKRPARPGRCGVAIPVLAGLAVAALAAGSEQANAQTSQTFFPPPTAAPPEATPPVQPVQPAPRARRTPATEQPPAGVAPAKPAGRQSTSPQRQRATNAAKPAPKGEKQGLSLMKGGEGPLDITGDQALEWRRDVKQYIARGNAHAKRGTVDLRATTLTAYYRDVQGSAEVFKIVADGNVVLTSPTDTLRGDQGVYDVDQALFRVTGKALEIRSGTDRITARDSLEYWEARKQAIANGDARATRADRKIRADRLVADFDEGPTGDLTARRVTATGSVCVESANNIARGARGDYDVPRGIVILTDDVRIARGPDIARGAKAEVNLITGISRMLAGDGPASVRIGSGQPTQPSQQRIVGSFTQQKGPETKPVSSDPGTAGSSAAVDPAVPTPPATSGVLANKSAMPPCE